MKKLFYLAFIAVLAMSFGCAITNYPVVTDTENDAAGFVVNTNGQASIVPSSQVITLFPDQNVELHSAVDQDGAGNQTLWTYSNISFGSPKFLGYTYCQPDFNGCWVAKAPNPVAGDSDIFDYTWNTSCNGADALSLLVSFGARTAECGRTAPLKKGDILKLADVLSTFRPASRYGLDGWSLTLHRGNLNVTATSLTTGVSSSIAFPPTQLFITSLDKSIIELGAGHEVVRRQLAALFRADQDGYDMEFNGPGGLTWNAQVNFTGAINNSIF